MPASVSADMPLLPELVVRGLERYNDRPFLCLGDQEVSYREVREQSSQFVQALGEAGVGRATRTAVLSGNRHEVLVNLIANLCLGACNTPLHPMGSLEDHVYILEDCGAEFLAFDPAHYGARAAEIAEALPHIKLFSFGPCDVGTDLTQVAATHTAAPLPNPEVRAEDLNTIVYTGGTTGRPKGVMQPYRSAAYMTLVQAAEWEWPTEMRFLISTPLSHAAAAFVVPTLQAGGKFVALPGFSPKMFFEAVEKHQITATFMVPVMIYSLLDYAAKSPQPMPSLETFYYGASPMSPARLAEGLQMWGQRFFQCFGQSEAPMVLAHLKKADHDLSKPERLASCGRPSPWTTLQLLDDDGNPASTGEPGEICVRGPVVMQGYLGLDEQTEEAFDGGWLRTGDIGRLDGDGFLHIVDRKKDMIVTGGFNVFPKEIEDVITRHPGVAMAAVVGVPDQRWGESVKAVVVVRQGVEASATLAAEIQELVKSAKGSVQTPKSIDFVDALPLSGLGKPDKKAIRAKYWSNNERGVA